MPKRHSPPVHYPLCPSTTLWWVWCCGVCLNTAVLLLWTVQGAGIGAQQFVRILAVVVIACGCALLSWRALRAQPQGVLCWSGAQWLLQCRRKDSAEFFEQELVGSAHVLLDLQSVLVLRFEYAADGKPRSQRILLEKKCAPSKWADLRRAVYSSVYPPPSPSVPAASRNSQIE